MTLGRLTIDLEAVAANWRQLARIAAPARTAAVVKANAYGLGIAPVVRRLAAEGVTEFFVATLDEGCTLRQLLPDATIAVLGEPVTGQASAFLECRLLPTLNHPGDLAAWQAEGDGQPAWLHLDTGMHRLGFSPAEWCVLMDEKPDWRALGIVGLMSHYACADDPSHPLNAMQRDAAMAAAAKSGLPLSMGNSSGIHLGSSYCGDLVRPGMALYGLNPTPGQPNPMRPAVSLAAQVLQVRKVDAEGTVGYGASAPVRPGQVLATIALGYADGLSRALSNRGHVFFGGQPASIVGRVSMDSIVVDVSALNVSALNPLPKPGDWAEIMGPHQTADDLAAAAGTIGYEILTSLGHRYSRVYKSVSDDQEPGV
ncbi:MAG: alanine racemase [Alphaproteobacteria bacterium]